MRSRTLGLSLAILSLSGCATSASLNRSDFAALEVRARPPAPKKQEKIEIRDKIQFELGKAALKKESHAILDEVVKLRRS